MAKELHKILFYIVIVLLIDFNGIGYAVISEDEYLKNIISLANAGKKEELVRTSGNYFKDYPSGDLVADVRFILAENEQEARKAVDQYRTIVNKYKYFGKRDIAQYRICEILYLQSKWDELLRESQKGVELFKSSGFLIKFQFLLTKAHINLERFDAAKKVCLEIIEHDHDYNNLSDGLILLSYINRNIYGFSRSYLYSLNEIITGFGKSGNMPAALFLLGRYYENREEYDKAYSAYSDVAKDYKKSPEAEFSRSRLSVLAKYNPRRTDYLPDRKTIEKTDKIDIQPEMDMTDAEDGKEENVINESNVHYSISLGPFNNINNAREIKNLIQKDFQNVEIAETRDGFYIYTGKFINTDSAIKVKIRLAEEFGINGNIVKMIRDTKRVYIYEQ